VVPGCDVSNHNGVIDWSRVAGAGYRFGCVKASEGNYYRDPYFLANWNGLKQNRLYRGAYHYGAPSSGTDPNAEADFFCGIVAPVLETGDITILDIEDPNVSPAANLLNWTLTWLRRVEANLGFKPIIYSGHYYLGPHNLEGHAELSDYGLWVASYQANPPPAPAGWSFFAFWQHADDGQVPGVGKCDLDYFMGPEDRIPLYGKPAPVVQPPEPSIKWDSVEAALQHVQDAEASLKDALGLA
jgi:lysozyme